MEPNPEFAAALDEAENEAFAVTHATFRESIECLRGHDPKLAGGLSGALREIFRCGFYRGYMHGRSGPK